MERVKEEYEDEDVSVDVKDDPVDVKDDPVDMKEVNFILATLYEYVSSQNGHSVGVADQMCQIPKVKEVKGERMSKEPEIGETSKNRGQDMDAVPEIENASENPEKNNMDTVSGDEETLNNPEGEKGQNMDAMIAAAWRLLQETNYLSDTEYDDLQSPCVLGKPHEEETSAKGPASPEAERNDSHHCKTQAAGTLSTPDELPSSQKSQVESGAKENTYKVTVSGEGFSKKEDIKNHVLVHQKSAQLTPEDIVVQKEKKDKPLETVRGYLSEYAWERDDCGKKFKEKSGLTQHKMLPPKIGSFACNVNKQSYDTESSLKENVIVDNPVCTGSRPYKCTVCGKGYSYKSSLRRHEIVHTGENSHKCNVCGKGFIDKSSLKNHRFVHTRVKPFMCYICDKGYTKRCNLRKHMLLHTG